MQAKPKDLTEMRDVIGRLTPEIMRASLVDIKLDEEPTEEKPLFEIENPLDWTDEQLVLPPVLIDRFLHKGHIGMLSGSMKTNKSWTMMDLAIALATGGEWFGRKCEETKVLYLDAEIQRPFWKRRLAWLCEQRGLAYKDVIQRQNIRPVFLSGKTPDLESLSNELKRLLELGELDGYRMIVLDPIYQFYSEEWEENSNSHIGILGRILRSIAEMSGISIMFAHHHAKGNQDGKRDIEEASGGGSFGRFVAASLAITLKDEAVSQYTLGWTTSHFAPAPKQVAYREEYGWRISEESAADLPKRLHTQEEVLECLPSYGASSDIWLSKCREKHPEMTEGAFETVRVKLSKAKRCYFDRKSGDKWFPAKEELEKRGELLAL